MLFFQMVHELLELMYEDQGQPKQLHNEVGNLIILDRGECECEIAYLYNIVY